MRLYWDDQTALLAAGQFLRYNIYLAKSPHNDEDPEIKTALTNSLDLTDLDPAQAQCSRINGNRNYISQDFFHFPSFILNGAV